MRFFTIMSDLQTLIQSLKRQVSVEDSEANAAVAILLCAKQTEPELLLVKRAVNPSDPWSGDMALPGGRKHQNDRNILETAVRETREETSIDLSLCYAIGHLQTHTSNRSTSPVHILPFVFVCAEKPEIHLNQELSKFIWVPLSMLKQPKVTGVVHGREVPCFPAMGEVIWGLTFRILTSLLDLL